MGTKLEGKSYLPGYLTMRDLSVNANSTWTGYYEENMLSGPMFDNFMARQTCGSQYHKEMLKRMMLEHEATFRKQVYELHRLYKIQKDLMQEFQRKELPRYSIPPDTSRLKSLMFQMPSEGTRGIWHTPFLKATYESSHIAGPVDVKPLLNFLKEGCIQSSPNTVSSKDELPRSKQMFDLQLPGDGYIENEDAERSRKKNTAESSFKPIDPLDITCSTNPGSDVKLTLATSESHSRREDSWISDKQKQNILGGHKLADLNEPTTGMCCKEAGDSASTDFLGLNTFNKEDHWRHLPMTSNTRFLGSKGEDFFKVRHPDERTSSNFFDANVRMKQILSTSNKENGKSICSLKNFTPESCNGEFRRSSEKTDMKQDRSRTVEWFIRKNDGVETSKRNNFSSSKNSGQADPPIPASFPNLQMDHTGDASPLVSSSAKTRRNSSHIPLAVQAHPGFSGLSTMNLQRSTNIAIQNTDTAIRKWETNGHLTLDPRSQSENPYLNGFCQSVPSQVSFSHLQHPSMISWDLDKNSNSNGLYGNSGGRCLTSLQHAHSKCLKNINLNQALPDGILEGKNDKDIVNLERKGEETGVEISWLRTKAAGNESVDIKSSQTAFSLTHGNYQLMSSSSGVSQECGSKHGKDLEDSKDIAARILGFLVCGKIQESTANSPTADKRKPLIDINKQIGSESLCYTSITCDLQVPSTDKESQRLDNLESCTIGKGTKIMRNHIDLNDDSSFLDNLESSELPYGGQVIIPLKNSVPSVCAKASYEIDLEAPVFLAEGIVNFQQESVVSGKQEGSQEEDCCHDSFAIVAAKNILAMSMDKQTCLDIITSLPASPPPCDTLHWFAEVTITTENSGVLTMNNGPNESADDGVDLFESMTLMLEETKTDDYCCSNKVTDNNKEEETAAVSLLLTKTRRGQGRRRRQRRDFQKDILPGLASLSRHEVSEDLLTIGGLLKASGLSWQTSLTRRTGRHGSQANGRRQLRSSAVSIPEIHVSPPPLQPISTDMDTDGRSMIGWGRTTRRCRRTRCPPGNAPAPVAQTS